MKNQYISALLIIVVTLSFTNCQEVNHFKIGNYILPDKSISMKADVYFSSSNIE
jgi:hypothetical protein